MSELNNKDLLISTSFDMFRKDGYENTSISMIRKEAGLSNGTFYHYFKTKEDLLTAICLQKIDLYDLEDGMEEKANAPREHLIRYFQSWRDYWEVLGRNIASQIYRIYNYAFLDVDSKETRSIKKAWQTYHLEAFIALAQEKGTVKTDFSAEEYCRLLFMLTRGMLFEWIIQPEASLKELSDAYLPVIVDMILK